MKLYSDKNMNCEWSIYKVTDDEMKEYYASISFDFGQQYQKAVESFSNKGKIGAMMQNYQ